MQPPKWLRVKRRYQIRSGKFMTKQQSRRATPHKTSRPREKRKRRAAAVLVRVRASSYPAGPAPEVPAETPSGMSHTLALLASGEGAAAIELLVSRVNGAEGVL